MVFAAVLLLFVGSVNIIYGIGAIDNANVFVGDTRLVFDDLNTYGWVLIILGVIQLSGGFSLLAGNVYGRVLGILGGSLGALSALVSMGGANPWWSLAVFALCVYVVHGIIIFGEDENTQSENVAGRPPSGGRPAPHQKANVEGSAFGTSFVIRCISPRKRVSSG